MMPMSEPHETFSEPELYAYDNDGDYCGLFETVFGKSMGKSESLNHFRWEYCRNPAGRAVIMVVRNERGRIVSAYPTMPLRMQLLSKKVRGGLSFDSMTHPHYRGKRLFTTLGQAAYRRLEADEYAVSYGFPNKNIQKLRTRHLGWFEICSFPLLLKIMDFRPFLKRILKFRIPANITGSLLNKIIVPAPPPPTRKSRPLTVEGISGFDAEFDGFWEKTRCLFNICVERDARYLQWRYARPEETYAILRLRRGTGMEGYAVLKCESRFNLHTGYIMDFIVSPVEECIRELLLATVMHFQEKKVDAISTLLMRDTPYHRFFREAGFRSIPPLLQPQEIHFSARTNIGDGHTEKNILDSRKWFISWGDTDLL